MRKKSHISLSRGIIKGLETDSRIKHKHTFYIGSIMPDCVPSFLVKRHNVEQTFDIFVGHMEKFTAKFKMKENLSYGSTLRMGIIMHYLADYFTFPHNAHYKGGFKDHCIYEADQFKCMKQFIEGIKLGDIKVDLPVFDNIKQIVDYVKAKHEEYINGQNNVKSDCDYSFKTCLCVAASLLNIAEKRAVVTA